VGGTERRLSRLQVDGPGQVAHAILGSLMSFLIAFPTTWVEFAGVPLLVFWVVRLRRTLPTFFDVVREPISVIVLALAAWSAISLSWSADPALGAGQLASLRWVWMLLLLYPILERRRWLILALAAGFMIGNLSQVSHAIGRWQGIEWMTWKRLPDRNSGWWDPVVGGTMLVAALGLHIPAALFGRGRWRWIGVAGVSGTAVAIGATGTRGAMLAGTALLLLAGLWWVVRGGRGAMQRALIAGLASVLVLGGVWIAAGDSISRRVDLARADLSAAIDRGEFTSDTGARVIMAWWAIEAVREHPIAGVGYGGFRAWSSEQLRSQGVDPASRSLHDHAHNALLHQAATTGLVGLGLALAVVGIGLRNAAHIARRGMEAAAGLSTAGANIYLAGPLCAMVGLLLVSVFDSIQVNAQTAAVGLFLLAITACPERIEGGREA
jgi:O-antigen ligase